MLNYPFRIFLAILFIWIPLGFSSIAYASSISALPIESKLYGLSYPDWVANYYRWIASIPEEENHPVLDKTGQSCSTYQNDSKIFYLVDALSGNPVVRQVYRYPKIRQY